MPTRNFRIIHGNPANGELTLLAGGRGDMKLREKYQYTIYWEVVPLANVTSIESIKLKKQPNDELFSSIGPTDAPKNRHWMGVTKPGVSSDDYMYSIFWNTTPPAIVPYTHDPKIAVLPSVGFSRLIQKIVSAVVVMVLALFGVFKLFSLRKKIKADK